MRTAQSRSGAVSLPGVLGVLAAIFTGLATVAGTAAGCGGAAAGLEPRGVSDGPALLLVGVEHAPRVRPGAGLAVAVRARNQGDRAWEPGRTWLELAAAPGWSGGRLELAAPVAVGTPGAFQGVLVAPARPGLERVGLRAVALGTGFGVLDLEVEVTCSDGVFCNGPERWSEGRCVPAPPPCDDGQACTRDSCDEARGACRVSPSAACASCGVALIAAAPAAVACEAGQSACTGLPGCDGLRPSCAGGCAPGEYCGADCGCHAVGQPLPDLRPEGARLAATVGFETRFFDPDGCEVRRGCVGAPGQRKVLRFGLEVTNQGRADLRVPGGLEPAPPVCPGDDGAPDFAEVSLLDANGKPVVSGRRQAACVQDASRELLGPAYARAPRFDCRTQGLQAGWAVVLGNTLDCQWLDVTGVPPGVYQLQVRVNPLRRYLEATWDNNEARVPVRVP